MSTGPMTDNNEKEKDNEDMESVCSSTERLHTQTKHRNFKVIVGGSDYYINAHWLADCSPFFDVLCFGEFSEAKQGAAEIADLSRDDWETFLFVMGADTKYPCEDIDEVNCAVCLKLADRFDVDVLKRRCVDYLGDEFCEIQPDIDTTLNILLACEACSVDGNALTNVVSRLAGFGADALRDNDVHKKVKTPTLIAALFENAATFEQRSCHTAMAPTAIVLPTDCMYKYCDVVGSSEVIMCSHCHIRLCPEHMKLPCFNLAGRSSGRVQWINRMKVVVDYLGHAYVDLKNYE